MIITILQDNTVYARFDDGTSETINSSHAHKGKIALTREVAAALPYKGAMLFADGYEAPVFDSNTATIQVGPRTLTPDSDVSAESADVQALFNTLYPNETAPATKLYRALQRG